MNKQAETIYFFLFPAKLALYDKPDGIILAQHFFHMTLPIDPQQVTTLEKIIGTLPKAEQLYRPILETLTMQILQVKLPHVLTQFLDSCRLIPGLKVPPNANFRVLVDGTITVSGEACLLREDPRVSDIFRPIYNGKS